MKKILTLAVLFFVTYCSYGQITLDQTFMYKYATYLQFSSNGKKIYRFDSGSNQIKLLNLDYSLWRTMTIPNLTDYKFYFAQNISDNLFNSDNNIEYVVTYSSIDNTTRPTFRSKIVNEAGAVIYDLDSCYTAQVVNIDGAFKLISYEIAWPTAFRHTKIYSLPGTLPCGSCGGLGVPKYNNENSAEISSPMPNPNSGLTTISYSLPNSYNSGVITIFDLSGAIVKMYQVDRTSTELQINTTDLPSGLYYYNLTNNGVELATKKMVKL